MAKATSPECLQILDESGKANPKLMPDLSKGEILKMYEYMVLTRLFDGRMFSMQRQGRMGTFGQSLGQEAAQIGSALALQDEDWVFPSFREHGVHLARKFPMAQYMQYWSGDERGGRVPLGVNIFTIAIPVASQIPHAVGFAWAMKMKRKNIVTAVYFGDGATSRGDFHEGMNFAGVFKVPCVFVCQNNQWAISLPVSRQTASRTLAQKAAAYGFSGVRVDGNDIFAVYAAMKKAADAARKGNGPALIECLTYRMADHTTSDDSKRYRSAEDVSGWQKKDPIARLEKFMISKKMLSKTEKEKIWADAAAKIDAAVKEFESIKPPQPEDMFTSVYAEMPQELKKQMQETKENQNLPRIETAEKEEKDEGVAQ